jgi:hypothetical protein
VYLPSRFRAFNQLRPNALRSIILQQIPSKRSILLTFFCAEGNSDEIATVLFLR